MSRRSLISQKKKKRGPAPTGKGEPVLVRIQPDQMRHLDRWIREQDDVPSRPEAIRRLVETALASATSTKPTSEKAAAKATELAAKTIDHLIDAVTPVAAVEERQKRKRRLLKGPSEFREMREDLPKSKT